MADTLENLHRRKESAAELSSVVKTMKALAAANIDQYQMAVKSLQDYDRTVILGIYACLIQPLGIQPEYKGNTQKKETNIIALVFGSDMGLVGRFNDTVASYMLQNISDLSGKKEIWVVGERMVTALAGNEIFIGKSFAIPNSVDGITSLINQILISAEEYREQKLVDAFYIFHNAPYEGEGYYPINRQLLPLDNNWKSSLNISAWPTKMSPEVIGGGPIVLPSLIKEYFFVLLYKACAESLASENASRLEAMQRAEKNIEQTLDDLNQQYNRLRQSTIDEELFDVVAGFEALRQNLTK